jgi:hypothetical protein
MSTVLSTAGTRDNHLVLWVLRQPYVLLLWIHKGLHSFNICEFTKELHGFNTFHINSFIHLFYIPLIFTDVELVIYIVSIVGKKVYTVVSYCNITVSIVHAWRTEFLIFNLRVPFVFYFHFSYIKCFIAQWM